MLETIALSEQHHRRLRLCVTNLTRRIGGVKSVERRRMNYLREEVGTRKACIIGKVVKNGMK